MPVLIFLGKSEAGKLLTDRLLCCIITLFAYTLNQPYVNVPSTHNDCVHWLLIHQELFTHGGCKDSPPEKPLIKKTHEQMLIELPKLFPFFIYLCSVLILIKLTQSESEHGEILVVVNRDWDFKLSICCRC